ILIDFNPRFYGEMAFEIARDPPLPLLVYLAALGKRSELAEAVERARAAPDEPLKGYGHRLNLELVVRAQRISGGLSRADAQHWRGWLAARREKVVDAVLDPNDQLPAVAEVISQLLRYTRHPRAFLRQIVLDR